ncbi:oxidoreductase [Microbulbifer spongiae]|uniref:Oxidoreductase n=1 Tax=Microbulbifer spongiae TaxID=2944933 RepID=A0ABY9E7G3_9GAMM|nr:oxidoreductase [Microbulbifer sp. MI-G]WKD48958.1 oxidoreductase [Microbulbifer sp. MI-G]
MSWSLSDMPDMSGKEVIVTGGNVGLGFKSSLEMARKGASVTIACRSEVKGKIAVDRILKTVGEGNVQVLPLDLTDLASIKAFSEEFSSSRKSLDIVLANAGVVNLEKHQTVWGGHEAHMATNHYGHFALVGRLWPLLLSTDGSRVVVVSSLAYKQGVIDFDDLTWDKRPYNRMKCYGDSKLANLLFVNSFNRLSTKNNTSVIAVAAHPGLTATECQQSIGIGGKLAKWIASPVERGCLPQLLASSASMVKAGDFYGPKFGLIGSPKQLKLDRKALDESVADRLWDVSEKITQVSYN